MGGRGDMTEMDATSPGPGTQLSLDIQKGLVQVCAQQGSACVCYFWPQRLKPPQSKMSKAVLPEISGTALCKTRILRPNRLMMTDSHPGQVTGLQEAVSTS